MLSFVYWKKTRIPKSSFEINWPLFVTNCMIFLARHHLCPSYSTKVCGSDGIGNWFLWVMLITYFFAITGFVASQRYIIHNKLRPGIKYGILGATTCANCHRQDLLVHQYESYIIAHWCWFIFMAHPFWLLCCSLVHILIKDSLYSLIVITLLCAE